MRNLIARFNRSIFERVAASRHKHAVPIKVSFDAIGKTGNPGELPKSLSMMGETADLSRTGIAFLVPSIRIKENYLVGENRTLTAELDLPNGKVSMKIIGRRYEQVGEHISTARYLVGAKIEQITAENREAYEEFLRLGSKIGKHAGELNFGIGKR